ncbi:MAG: protein translocase subunit SecF [Clostridia bacterium]|nr:protein translocase subunit SecF [Clostridia bacterium]
MLNVIKSKWICLGISIAIILLGIIFYFVNGGFNLDIDFTGGTTLTIDMQGKSFTTDEISALIKDTLGYSASNVQTSNGNIIISISTPKTINSNVALSTDDRTKLFNAIKEKYGIDDNALTDHDSIDATIGQELKHSAILSCIFALILMLIYISIRFEFLSGIAAVLSLTHNVLVLLSIYVIFQLNINTTFIAAILTIVGYSINDTIVTFDRIREIMHKVKKTPFKDIVNRGVNETLVRSINTSITTLLTIVILYFVGVTSIKEFALPIIIGILVGTYSSIFIASPIWSILKKEKTVTNKAV